MSNAYENMIQDSMENCVKKLESITGKNSIVVFDLFYVHQFNKRTTIKSYTLGPKEYINDILPAYLSEFGSIGNIKRSVKNSKKIANSKTQAYASPRKFCVIDNIEPGKSSTFDTLVDYLGKQNFGQYCYWLNIQQEMGNAITTLSVFLILNKDTSKRSEAIENILQWVMLTDFDRFIMEEFIDLNNKNEERISQLMIQNLSLREYEKRVLAHKHSFFQLDIETPLQNAADFLKVKKYDLAADSINSTLREYNIFHVINCSVFGKNDDINKLYNKSIIEILQFLDSNYGSTDLKPAMNFTAIKNADFVPAGHTLIDHFTLILNLWKNSSKSYGGLNKRFEIIAREKNGGLSLLFKNQPAIEGKFIKFLTDPEAEYPADDQYLSHDPKYRGLHIIRDVASKLDAAIMASTHENNTIIEILLNKQNEHSSGR